MPPLPSGLLSLLLICAQTLSRVRLFATPCQAPLSMGILQARILEWVAMPSSKGSSQPRDRTHISCICLHWQEGSLPLMPPGKPKAFLLGSVAACSHSCSHPLQTQQRSSPRRAPTIQIHLTFYSTRHPRR